MKRWMGLALLVFVGSAGWRIGEALSPDALSMAVGVLFGVLAGVPTALLVIAGSRRRNDDAPREERRRRQPRGQLMPMNGQVAEHTYGQMAGQMNGWTMPYAQQPPIIVVAGPQGFGSAFQPTQSNASWFPQEPPLRQFTVVGEGEELVEDW